MVNGPDTGKNYDKKMDWMDFNFQHNFNDRNIIGQIFEKSKSRIGKNFMANRLSTINWKIGYTWLSQGLATYKVKCKPHFFTYN